MPGQSRQPLEGQILRERFAPVSAFRGITEAGFAWGNRFAIGIDQFGVGQVVLFGVGVLHVAD